MNHKILICTPWVYKHLILKLPDGTVKVLVEGEKIKILNIEKSKAIF